MRRRSINALVAGAGRPRCYPAGGLCCLLVQAMRQMGYGQPYAKAPLGNEQSATDVSFGTQQAIRQSLPRNGFRDVIVEPRTFAVHAQTPDGSHIVMLVGLERVSGIIMNMGNAAQTNESTQNGSSNWNQGGVNH